MRSIDTKKLNSRAKKLGFEFFTTAIRYMVEMAKVPSVEIADVLGCSAAWVRNYIKAANLETEKTHQIQYVLDGLHLAHWYGFHNLQDTILYLYFNRFWTSGQIARVLNCSKMVIRKAIKANGRQMRDKKQAQLTKEVRKQTEKEVNEVLTKAKRFSSFKSILEKDKFVCHRYLLLGVIDYVLLSNIVNATGHVIYDVPEFGDIGSAKLFFVLFPMDRFALKTYEHNIHNFTENKEIVEKIKQLPVKNISFSFDCPSLFIENTGGHTTYAPSNEKHLTIDVEFYA